MQGYEELYAEVGEAQELIQQAIEKLERVVVERPGLSRYYEVYVVNPLKILASSDHNFLSRDSNLDDWKRALREGEDDLPEPAGSGESASLEEE